MKLVGDESLSSNDAPVEARVESKGKIEESLLRAHELPIEDDGESELSDSESFVIAEVGEVEALEFR